MACQFDPMTGDLVKAIQLKHSAKKEDSAGGATRPALVRAGVPDDSPDGARAISTALAWLTERYLYRAFKHGTSLADAALLLGDEQERGGDEQRGGGGAVDSPGDGLGAAVAEHDGGVGDRDDGSDQNHPAE